MSAPLAALSHWAVPAPPSLTVISSGLINETWRVDVDGSPFAILQRLNTEIFEASVHEDMRGIGAALSAAGVGAPTLIPTVDGAIWATLEDGVWRMMTHLGDRTATTLTSPSDARSAGALIGRFHRALAGLDWRFHHIRPGAHDTPKHVSTLTAAVTDRPSHRLATPVRELAERIVSHWELLAPTVPTGLPRRIIHGDLKISNVRFEGPEAVALVDLDTLAHGTLDVEMGDAMRSWCNRASEDSAGAAIDVELFAAGMEGWLSAAGAWGPTADERASIVTGWRRIALELSARFAADALNESYFGWDASRFPAAGEHNLLRAQGQLALAEAVASRQGELEAIVAAL